MLKDGRSVSDFARMHPKCAAILELATDPDITPAQLSAMMRAGSRLTWAKLTW